MAISTRVWTRLVFALLASTSPAQSVLVVDASGAGQFRDIPPALAIANHGDTLDVRPGTYTCGTTSAGIKIVGGPGRLLRSGTFLVRDVPANRTFSMVGFAEATVQDDIAVHVEDCAGPVAFAELGGTPCLNVFGRQCPSFRVHIESSSTVSLTDSILRGLADQLPALTMDGNRSGLTVTRCTLTADGSINYSGLEAVRILDGRVSFVACRVAGANGSSLPRISGGHALIARDGRVRAARSDFLGGATLVFVSGWRETGLFIGAAADAVIDPSVTHTAGYSPTKPRVAVVPAVDAPPLGVGGVLAPRWSGGLGQPCVLAASVAGPRVPVPWGDLWIDPTVMVALYIGPAVPSPVSLNLGPAFTSGTTVTLQGLVALPTLVLTNAQTLVVR